MPKEPMKSGDRATILDCLTVLKSGGMIQDFTFDVPKDDNSAHMTIVIQPFFSTLPLYHIKLYVQEDI